VSFFEELKRRNVFKVGLAYFVASWLVLQITDVLMSVLGLSEFAGKFVFLLLVIGFIPVLVFAWAYEVTPEGIKRESEVDRSAAITHETSARLNRITIVMLVAVAVMVVVDRFVPEGEMGEMGSEPFSQQASENIDAQEEEKRGLTPAPASDGRQSVAVLPFVNMSSDAENEYFSDGITEELLNLLVKVDGLRVPSRTSSFAFKGQNTDIREIARQLDVNHILEGSVRKAGNQVRITAQLIDVETDAHLWSETYDRQLENIFAIQDEIANQIVNALHVTLTGVGNTAAPTENMAAYNLYLQGRFHFQQRGPALARAEEYLRQAVELDPQFAEAWATLALVYVMKPNYLGTALEEAEPLAREAAQRAEALNPELPEPLMVRGDLAGKHSKLTDQFAQMEKATRKQPHNALARTWWGISLLEGGYLEEAAEQLERAMKDDPVSGLNADWLSRVLYMLGEKARAEVLAMRAIELGRWPAYLTMAHIHLDDGNFEAARNLLELVPYEPFKLRFATVIDAVENPALVPQVYERLASITAEGNDPGSFIEATVNFYLANAEGLFAVMPKAIPSDATVLTGLWTPVAKTIRQHPQMQAFARDHGLLELWQARGWPDLCRPLGDGGFECD
jgi:TolB-like protein